MSARDRLRGAIRVGIAHWAFGNLYEEVVRMPERVAERPGPGGSPLGPGEPARYYVPAGPVTVVAAVADAVARHRRGTGDPARDVAAGALVAAAGIGGYLIRTVNVPLVSGTAPPAERATMVARWHRWNRVRLVLLGVAAAASAAPTAPARQGPGTAVPGPAGSGQPPAARP